MNIHFLIGDTLVTPSLTGSVLSGITRDSVITLAKEWGYEVQERKISIDEIMQASVDGHLQEVFGSGTAAVISPVGRIAHKGQEITISSGKIGQLAKRLHDTITGIQYGQLEDPFDWAHPVNIQS